MKIVVNDKEMSVSDDTTLAQLITTLNLPSDESTCIIASINDKLIRGNSSNILLQKGDFIIVYPMMAGG